MSDPINVPASVVRVQAALTRLGAAGEIRALDASARTAKEAADTLGVDVGQIANSLVFWADDSPLLVIASGAHRGDTSAIADVCGYSTITKANADQVRSATGFVIGGVAPVGSVESIPTVIDTCLDQYEQVWAAGGHSHWVFPTSFAELLHITGGQAASIGMTTEGG